MLVAEDDILRKGGGGCKLKYMSASLLARSCAFRKLGIFSWGISMGLCFSQDLDISIVGIDIRTPQNSPHTEKRVVKLYLA